MENDGGKRLQEILADQTIESEEQLKNQLIREKAILDDLTANPAIKQGITEHVRGSIQTLLTAQSIAAGMNNPVAFQTAAGGTLALYEFLSWVQQYTTPIEQMQLTPNQQEQQDA